MSEKKVDLLVLGAGPGGYVCAIRAAKQGIDTLVVEQHKPGGTCLNVGCIPSKALIHAAGEFHNAVSYSAENELGITAGKPQINFAATLAWKNRIVENLNDGVSGLLQRAGASVLYGNARFLDGKTVEVQSADGVIRVHAKNIVIATGSEPIEVPALPFGGNVMSSTEALELTEIPETLAVVGGGYIGLEIGIAYAKLGARVVVVEASDRILPQYDSALTAPVAKRLSALNVELMLNAKAHGLSGNKPAGNNKSGSNGAGNNLEIELQDGSTRSLAASKVLVTVGRKPRSDYGLEELSLTMDGSFIAIDNKCQTSMRGVYAIGDVTGEPMLAHRAMAQGEVVADVIAGGDTIYDKQCIPAVCFTDPEIVSVGLSPADATEQGIDTTVGQFPLQASGRAMTMERTDGFIRVVALKENGMVLGVQAVGSQVSELSAVFALAIEMGARIEDIAATVHAHPTISEGFQEACMNALGHGLHV